MQHKPSPYMRRFRLPQLGTFTVSPAPSSTVTSDSRYSAHDYRNRRNTGYDNELGYRQLGMDLNSPTSDDDDFDNENDSDFGDGWSTSEAKLGLIAFKNKQLRERKMHNEANATSSSSSGSHSSLGSAGGSASPAYNNRPAYLNYLNLNLNERRRSKSQGRTYALSQEWRNGLANLSRDDDDEVSNSGDDISVDNKSLSHEFQMFKRLNRQMQRLNLMNEPKADDSKADKCFGDKSVVCNNLKGNWSTNRQAIKRPQFLYFNSTPRSQSTVILAKRNL